MAEISNVSLVEEILIKASLTGMKQNFIDQKIDACMVSSLNDEELSRLGVQTIGERIRLRDAGKRIASQSQASLGVQPLQSQVTQNRSEVSVPATESGRTSFTFRGRTESSNLSRELGSMFGPKRSRYNIGCKSKKRKEKTFTGKFMCLSNKHKDRAPNAEEKTLLQRNFLGFKKIQFLSSDSEEEVKRKICGQFPALESCGGFELLRCGIGRVLNVIDGIKWDAKSLNECVGCQAHIYIRPIQRDIHINVEQNSNYNSIFENCLKCGQQINVVQLRNHINLCGEGIDDVDNQVYVLPDLSPSGGQQIAQIGFTEPEQVLYIQSTEPQPILQLPTYEPQQLLQIPSTEPQQQILQIPSTEPQQVLQIPSTEPQQVLQIPSTEPQQVLQIQTPEPQQVHVVPSQSSEPGQMQTQVQSNSHEKDELQVPPPEPDQVLQINSAEPLLQYESFESQQSQVSNESPASVESIVVNTSMYCTQHNITDPIEILRVFQSKIVMGRPLDVSDTGVVPEGDVNFIMVNRSKKLECALDEIECIQNLRLCLDVQFYDESAVDLGGPRREFFTDVLREVNEKYFNPPREWSPHYQTIGKILALSLLQNCQLPKVMPTELLEEVFLKESTKPFVLDLRKGLDSLGLVQLVQYQPTLIHLFTPTSNPLTVRMLLHLLKPNFAIDGSNKREKEDAVYQRFVKYVREAASGRRSNVNLCKILRFATGAEAEPPLGFSIHPAIEFPQSENPLPTANTCVNQLNLPTAAQEMEKENQYSFYDLAFTNEYFGLH